VLSGFNLRFLLLDSLLVVSLVVNGVNNNQGWKVENIRTAKLLVVNRARNLVTY